MTLTPAALSLARRVRELLSEPGRWTQGAEALDARGEPCRPSSTRAVRWCLTGAADREGDIHDRVALYEQMHLCMGMPWIAISAWNDTHTHADVLALLDRVIEDGER